MTVPITVTSIIERTGRARQVAADDVEPVPARQGGEPRDERVEVGARQGRGQRQGEQRQPRRRAHRREVAQVDGERAMADGVGRREAAIEVDAFDERVDGQHLEPVPLRLDDRRIVADADEQPGGRRAAGCSLDPRDQLALAEVGDRWPGAG